jgi:hypothetical protein
MSGYEVKNPMEETTNFMKGMFGKVAPGMCRLSMNGGIAVKVPGGYKTYNVEKKILTNCTGFAFDIGDEFFFVIPTNKVVVGDIILVDGKPRCVRAVKDGNIEVINYENSVIETILPERHIFMGKQYFYGKVVSMFGNMTGKNNNAFQSMFKYKMMMDMMNTTSGSGNGSQNMLPMMFMFGGENNIFSNMFDGMLDMDNADDDEDNEEEAPKKSSSSKKNAKKKEEDEE